MRSPMAWSWAAAGAPPCRSCSPWASTHPVRRTRGSGPRSIVREGKTRRAAGGELDVSIALDPDTQVLYASLGCDRVAAWDGTQMKAITLDNAAPRKLAARGRAAVLSQQGLHRHRQRQRDGRQSRGDIPVFGRGVVHVVPRWPLRGLTGRGHSREGIRGRRAGELTEDYRLRIEGQ